MTQNTISPPLVDLQQMKASLAAELAVGLLPLPEILTRFGLNQGQLQLLLKDESFRKMVRQFKREWHEASNAKERIKLKASLMVEDNLLELHRIFNQLDLNPNARLDAFKQMVVLADAAPKKEGGSDGPRFNLTLNLGGEQKSVVVDAVSEVVDVEE